MDQFKQEEILRMEKGGNKACKAFFAAAPEYESSMSIAERYGAPFAEDYKEKLTADIEGREWVPSPRKAPTAAAPKRIATTGIGSDGSRSSSPAAPQKPGLGSDQKVKNEEYFSRLGSANAGRPSHVPPNQGGKYAGFGSTPAEPSGPANDNPLEDVAATITRSFWGFASTVTRAAKTANEQFIQPTAQKIAESEITKKTIENAATLGQKVSETAQYGVESARRYVDNTGQPGYRPVNTGGSTGGWQGGPDADRRGFWDSFGATDDDDMDGNDGRFYDRDTNKPGALGTSTMKKSNSSAGGAGGSSSTTSGPGSSSSSGVKKAAQKDDDGWEAW